MARERPILFSGEMVRAILEERKTQTRRVIKPQPHVTACGLQTPPEQLDDLVKAAWAAGFVDVVPPFGVEGDRLWVRERFSPFGHDGSPRTITEASYVVLQDGAQKHRSGHHFMALPKYAPHAFDGIKWRPSIHMPRWASRLTLEVTSVRVERLQDISDVDARAEGVTPLQMDAGSYLPRFEGLWDSLNAKRAPWASNPWVWVVSFRKDG